MNITDITKQIRALADQLESTQTSAPVDPYAELKAAHAAGKVIEYRDAGSQWMWVECKRPIWYKTAEYRIKPDAPPFQLPPPPPGMSWHRKDGWKAEDLPPGTRPHVYGEGDSPGDEVLANGHWNKTRVAVATGSFESNNHRRTTRPLVFEHEGKQWTWHRPGDPRPCDGERSVNLLGAGPRYLESQSEKGSFWLWQSEVLNCIGWRYAEPLTREVELGPEDVPPTTVLRGAGEVGSKGWCLITSCSEVGIRIWRQSEASGREITWQRLRESESQINRPRHRDADGNPTLWEKCSKEVPA